jgi:hypothetical protein
VSSYSEAESREAAAEAAAARLRARQERLRQLVREFEVPAAETASIEERLAAVTAARARLDRHAAVTAREIERAGADLGEHVSAMSATFSAARRETADLHRELDARAAELSATITALDRERADRAGQARAAFDEEVAAGAERAAATATMRDRLLEQAIETLSGLGPAAISVAGLSAEWEALRTRTDRACVLLGDDGLIAARRLADDVATLASEVRWRAARVDATRRMLAADVEAVRSQLEFSPDERRLLVGSGDRAIDAPLRAELDRLSNALETTALLYDSLEPRTAAIATAIDRVGTEANRVSSDVKRFEQLNGHRFILVDETLPAMLGEIAGAPVEKLGEDVPALGLQPVEVHYRVPRTGELIDCTIGLDGSVRIHHHQHTSLRDCAAAAERMAEVVPRTLTLKHLPRMDETTPSSTPAAGATITPKERV